MFRRTFWFATGAAAGIWATATVQRSLRRLAPGSFAGQAAGRAAATGRRLREFTLDVRAGTARREQELSEALGLSAPSARPGTPGERTTLTTGNEDH